MLTANTRHNISLLLLALNLIFLIVGFAGAEGDIAWTYLKYENTALNLEQKYGMLALQQRAKIGGTMNSKTFQYNTEDCVNTHVCTKCYDAGATIMTMLSVGVITTMFAFGIIWFRKRDGGKNANNRCWKRFLGTCSCAITALVGFVSWGLWIGGCHEEILAYAKNNNLLYKDDYKLNAGFAMAFLVMVFSGLAALNEHFISQDTSLVAHTAV
ncbi:hypothetical protein AAMO2058_000062200 [Amorphochlora amoebiformis]